MILPNITPGTMFFDKAPVIRAVNAAHRRNLARAGALVRVTARRSIRKRKKTSQPGQPPSSHTGHLRNLIFFGYDQAHRTVVVGPRPYKQRGNRQTGAQVLEYGGRIRARRWQAARRGQRAGWQNQIWNYRPRPYMRPALAKTQDQIAEIWRDSVK